MENLVKTEYYLVLLTDRILSRSSITPLKAYSDIPNFQ